MHPGVTVVLATVWLMVYADVVGPTSIHPSRLTLDQYAPLVPQQQHGVYRRIEREPNWKDRNHDENQPFDLSIGSRRSISTSAVGSQEQSPGSKNFERETTLPRSGGNVDDDFSRLVQDKQSRNFVGRKFTDGKIDGRDTKGLESPSRELSPPSESEDPFVADETFQDQGPGSVEIYKLDLLIVNSLLSPTPMTRFVPKSKSKTPKKTSHTSWKAKTAEYKATSPKIFYKQSNSFDDSSTEVPPNSDPFSIGGVPELQVGCEGLEASDHSKRKRSVGSPDKGKSPDGIDPWADVTPISLDLNYDLSGEEGYEEMDELFKLKKLETTTKRVKQNRGDMEATLYSDFLDDKRGTEKLPVRGDLGKSSGRNDSSVLPATSSNGNRKAEEKATEEALHFAKGKREVRDEMKPVDGLAIGANQRRKILWFDDSDVAVLPENERRIKRGIWGFGEDEGVASSDELQTENQRRRQAYERRRKEEELRKLQEQEHRRREEAQWRSSIENRTNSDIEKIREEHEKLLEEKRRQEEERQGRLQQESHRQTRLQMEAQRRSRLQEEELRRNRWMDEERRRQELEASRRRHESRSRTHTYGEEKERQRQQEEEIKRREEDRLRDEQRRRVSHEEEERRRAQTEWEEEMKRRQQQERDRQTSEQRRSEWMSKRRQDEEEERRKHLQNRDEPSNLVYPVGAALNESRPYSAETERRMREHQERERQRKLNEYIQQNRPINVNSMDRRREETNRRRYEEERRRVEEERKLQEYIRRNQPVRVPKVNEPYDKNLQEYRRRIDEARQYNRSRYPGSGSGRRNHGPSAPTNIDPRDYVDEARRREAARRIEEERIRERERQQEQLRKEALRREEEVRRIQSRRYEEDRKRQEAARLEEERRAKELRETEARRSQAGRTRPLENTRPSYEDRRRFEDHRRRQDTSLIPANLLLNESRRTMGLERQRQEQERRRLEAERRRHEGSRAKEARENEQRARATEEQWRRQEEARLNALPVSAKIIVRPASPNLLSRMGFDTDIDFQGANPYRPGMKVPNFPAPPTQRPPVQSPPPCVWAVIQCCPSNINRLVTCFESMGCPGVNWDPNPCRGSIRQAAKEQVMKFYADTEAEDRLF